MIHCDTCGQNVPVTKQSKVKVHNWVLERDDEHVIEKCPGSGAKVG